ncbi:MAG: hypothetical protein VKK42_23735 [Lyngbya sp.]|nr:hypothetical protein [Lyngbya sp.]
MKILLILLISAVGMRILINRIEKYFLTFRAYNPEKSQSTSQQRWMAGLYKLLFWGLVLPLSYTKLLIETDSDKARYDQSPPKLNRVKPTSASQILSEKVG